MILTLKLFALFLISVFHNSCGQNQTNSPQDNFTSGQSRSDKEDQVVQAKTVNKLLRYTTGVRSILEDSKGNTWFGSYNEGVCLLQDGEFQYFTTENGLSNNQVRSIYEDKNGMIWFECGEGLSIYDGQKMTIYKESNYDQPEQWKLTGTDLWFKSDPVVGFSKLEKYPGLYQYDGQRLSYRKFPVIVKPGEHENKYSISTGFVKGKNGAIWLGTYGAVIGYNGSDFTIIDNDFVGITTGTSSLHVRSIMEDSKGNLWIGNNGMGVLKYDGKKLVNFTAQQKLKKEDTRGNSLDQVFSIGEDASGNIWFGTVYASGVWRYDGNSVKNFTMADGLDSRDIWFIYKSKQGELLFGGKDPSGVYRFNGKSFERKY